MTFSFPSVSGTLDSEGPPDQSSSFRVSSHPPGLASWQNGPMEVERCWIDDRPARSNISPPSLSEEEELLLSRALRAVISFRLYKSSPTSHWIYERPLDRAPFITIFGSGMDFMEDVFSRDVVKFSVTPSSKGGIDIEISSRTIHVPKYVSAHHPLIQMVLFANENWDEFHWPKSMAPNSIVDMVERSRPAATDGVYEGGWISTKLGHSESRNAGRKPSEFMGSDESLPVLFASEASSNVREKRLSNTAQQYGIILDPGTCNNHCCFLKNATFGNGITDANTVSQPHYGPCVTSEKISKISRPGNGGSGSEVAFPWQLLHQEKLAGGNHVVQLNVPPAQEAVCITTMNMEKIPTNEEGMVDCGIDSKGNSFVPVPSLPVQRILNNPGQERSNKPRSSGDSAITSSVQKGAHELGDTEPENHSEYDLCVAAEHGIIKAEDKTAATWLVASGAQHHATGNISLLSGFTPEYDLFVQAGDGAPMQVCGRGSVITDAVVLPDVWFVPGLTANLVSASQLTEIDYSVGFGRGMCNIRNATDGSLVGKAHVGEGGLFELDFLKVPLVANTSVARAAMLIN